MLDKTKFSELLAAQFLEVQRECDVLFHPVTRAFPLMEGEDFADLCADIEKNGLRRRIIMFERKVLSGRTRYRAMLRINPNFSPDASPQSFKQFRGKDALAFIISENWHRLHLNESQRAMIAAELCLAAPASRWQPGNRTADMARALKVSPGLVKEAKHRIRTGQGAPIKAGTARIGRRRSGHTVNVMLSPAEFSAFEKRCDAAGSTKTDVLRQLVLLFNAGQIGLPAH